MRKKIGAGFFAETVDNASVENSENKQPNKRDQQEQEKFFSAAKIVAVITMMSRILGLIRDRLIFGIGKNVIADRFLWAFAIPNMFRRLFGEGALTAAFLPVFTDVAGKDGWARARKVLANVLGILALILTAITILVAVGFWIGVQFVGADAMRIFQLRATALMLPFMITICMLAVCSTALNCKGHFVYPALAPIILNICLIVGAGFIAPWLGDSDESKFYILGACVVIAGVIQLIGAYWMLARVNLSAIPKLKPILPEIFAIAKQMLPMMIPLGILQFSAFADQTIALAFSGEGLPLEPGVVRNLQAAMRLYTLPLGVLAIPVGTVVFPLLSRYAMRDDKLGLCKTTNRALRLSFFLGIPAAIGLFVLAEPIVKMIFEKNKFTAENTKQAAFILRMYTFGLWAYFVNQILLRAFYAVKKPGKPLKIACCLVVLNLMLVLGGIFTPLAGGAIGLATAITQSINAILLIFLLRKMWGNIGLKKIAISVAKILLASALMGSAIYFTISNNIFAFSIDLKLFIIAPVVMHVLAAVCAGLITFFAAVKILKCAELEELFRKKIED